MPPKPVVPAVSVVPVVPVVPVGPIAPVGPVTTTPPTPDPNATSLAAGVPILLLPVRIETRFAKSTSTLPLPTAATAEPPEPATIARTSLGQLLVRVYPDTISISSFEAELTPDEVAAGSRYWQQRWWAGDSSSTSQAAWRAMAAQFGSQRAAWIARQMTPINLSARPTGTVDPAAATGPDPVWPSPPTRASSYEQAPTAEALPDFWTVSLERAGTTRQVHGSPVTPHLAVGLAPRDATFPDGLPVEEGMRWLVDFEQAVRVGMGLRIPLSPAEVAGGFDRIVVFGLRVAAPDGPGEQSLAQLLNGHHYSDGLAFVPQGSPTNNTPDASAAFTRDDPDNAVSFAVEAGPALAADTTADGARSAAALGIPSTTFDHVAHADGYGARNGRDMLTALWPATFGYFLDQMMNPVLTAAQQDAARAFALANAMPRGPLPAIRVGSTPYGVLPTTSLSTLGAPRIGRFVDNGPRAHLASLLVRLLPAWRASVSGAPHIGGTGDPDQDLAQVLGMDASSLAFRGRQVMGDDALWNLLIFFNQSSTSVNEWWGEHLARGRALLDSLGLQSWDPRVIHTAMGRDSYPVPYPTVHDAPLSESATLASDATVSGTPANYIQWLAHAPMADIWAESYPGTKPTSILYRILRQSVLREYVTQAGRAQVQAGTLATSALREVELVHVQAAAPTVTALDIVTRPVSAVSTQTWAEFMDTLKPTPASPFARLVDLRASMDRLATLPTAELDRALTETLDAASHRLDVWITALSTSLLADQRAAAPTVKQPRLHLGAYGWVEDVRPAPPPPALTGVEATAVARLDLARAQPTVAITRPTVFQPSVDNGGFIQAPSMTQAAAGAVLRSGYLSHRGTPDEPALAIDLSSARTRSALWLLAGVRQGLSLGALTGFQFEQQLHDQHLDPFIQPFRDAFPLVGNELTGETANGAVLPPSQVVDGVKLRTAWQGGALAVGATWGPGLPTPPSPAQSTVLTILEAIDDMLSALSDVSIAESVFQIMRGNFGRAGGILDAVSRGDHPPDPEIVATPRPGLDITQRFMLLLAGPPPVPAPWGSVTTHPRARLEPWLSNWVAGRLPDPSRVRALVSWTAAAAAGGGAGADETSSVTVSLRDLDVGPLDVLAFADAGDTPQRAEMELRLLRAANPPTSATTVTLEYGSTDLPPDTVTFPHLLFAARALRDLIGAARPLDIRAFALPDRSPSDGSIDLADLGSRITGLVAALDHDIAAVQAALAALGADPANQAALEAVAGSLVAASGYGLPGCLPPVGSSAAAVRSLAVDALAQLQQRRAAVDPTASTADDLLANAKAVLGATAVVLPHLEPPDGASVRAAFGQSGAMQAVDPQALRQWLLQLSHVRPAVQRYDLADAATKLLGAGRATIELAQLPLTPADRWLGLPFAPASPPAPGRVAIEAVTVGDATTASAYAGLLIDEWLDRIPSATTTSGVSFHYDEPTARAPQTLLLALCPDDRPTWDLGLVQEILDETLDLAQVRAVDLGSIQEVGQIVPALYFPFNLQSATPATHFLEVTNVDATAAAAAAPLR